MATLEISTVMIEARAAVEKSHRLLDQMRLLRQQLSHSLNAVRDSTATLVLNVGATTAGTAFGAMAGRLSPVAPSAAPAALSSRPLAVAALEPLRELQPLEANAPLPRPLDPKDQRGFNLLTPREMEVLRLIGEGHRTKEIAFALGISFKTAVTHRSNIMEKLGIHEGPRLVRFAIRTGITTA
jgi:DNA-binding NarL/FixJ family response regulator